jgi:hypothetical protein
MLLKGIVIGGRDDIVKDVVVVFCEAFHPSIPSSIHGWHHIIILYNVKAEKLL